MSDRLLRTFISVTLPKKIVSVSDMLKTTVIVKKENVKWVNAGNIHLTLKFLGHTPVEAADEINKVLEKVVVNYSGMELAIIGTGCFPNIERPRVLWVGIDGETNELQQFVTDLDKNLEKLGFPIEGNEFTPHITLARVKYPPKDIPKIANFINTSYEPIKFNVNRIRFMSSELFPNGPIYSILGTHFLGKNPK